KGGSEFLPGHDAFRRNDTDHGRRKCLLRRGRETRRQELVRTIRSGANRDDVFEPTAAPDQRDVVALTGGAVRDLFKTGLDGSVGADLTLRATPTSLCADQRRPSGVVPHLLQAAAVDGDWPDVEHADVRADAPFTIGLRALALRFGRRWLG